mgnify:CR=1 FL=1
MRKATYHIHMLGAQVPRVIVSQLTRPPVVHKQKQESRDTMDGADGRMLQLPLSL